MGILKLFDIPLVTVYAIINEKDKALFLHYSSNTPVALGRHVSLLKTGQHYCKGLLEAYTGGYWLKSKLTPAILEEVGNVQELRYRWSYFIDYYSNLGYTFYNNTKFTSRVTTEVDEVRQEIHVVVVNSKSDKIVLGRFPHIDDAENFISRHYGNKKVYKLIYKSPKKRRSGYQALRKRVKE
jgi:hypothetical protein